MTSDRAFADGWRHGVAGTTMPKWHMHAEATGSFKVEVYSNTETSSAYYIVDGSCAAISGYRFAGWSASADGTNIRASVCHWGYDNEGCAYYAVFEPLTYTASFNANGGLGGQGDSITVTYDADMPLMSSSAPSRDGYEFDGWYDTGASTGGTQYYTAAGVSAHPWDKTDNAMLYARWIPITYSIEFDANCEGEVSSPETLSAMYDAQVVLPVLRRDGYDFMGWNTKSDGTGANYDVDAAGSCSCENLTVVDESTVTLFAQWKDHVHVVSWQDRGQTLDSVQKNYGTTVTMLEAPPERTAYTFEGWCSSIDGSIFAANSDYVVPDASTVFTAVWKLKECTVAFDPGTGDESEITVIVPSPDPESFFAIPAPVARGRGYAFSHWGIADDDGINLWYPKGQLTVEGILQGGYPEADVLANEEINGAVYDNVITLHAIWTPMISVQTPLVVTMAIDPDTGETVVGEGYISTTGASEVSVLSLTYDKTDVSSSLGGGTDAVFGGDANGVSLTMTSVRDDEPDIDAAFASSAPFALDLGSQDGVPITGSALIAFPTFGDGVSVHIRYGLAFPPGFDLTSLIPTLPDKGDVEEGSTWSRESYPIANLHFTVGLVH